jgi:uncharacterized protein (DUF885 family)
MNRIVTALLLSTCAVASLSVSAENSPPAWVARSNAYTQQLLAVEYRYSPESGSEQGLARYDMLIGSPTLASQRAERRDLEAVLATLKAQQSLESSVHVREDLQIIIKSFDLRFRVEDYEETHLIPFFNADAMVFEGLHSLLDDQVAAARRPAAVERLKKYAGADAGSQPYTELLKQRTIARIGIKSMVYPSRSQLETELARNVNYVDGIAALFQKYKLQGWQQPYAKLKAQLSQYDAWLAASLLPKAPADFRMPPARYALALEGYGIDLPPAQLSAEATKEFIQIKSQMDLLATKIAKGKGEPASDYRSVITLLKREQITGDAILPFYKARLGEIERIVAAQHLVSLPARPAIIRLASAAETTQEPAPHMVPPAFINNHGERGEFVLPLNAPASGSGTAERYDDFSYDAAAWTLTAHEARPGHELQFDAMLESGVSIARTMFAFNSTNAEGWALYAEYLMQPYEPPEGQLITLQFRLLRAARAILDPGLQSGEVTISQAYTVLEQEVGLSHAFASEEIERYTYRAPGQAGSYFYGYTRLLSLREETQAALGSKFDQLKFHDFILQQGLLPPELLRKAVLEEFVPAQR